MSRANGNQRDADYLLDCSYFEYFWRIVIYNNWANEQEKQIAKMNKK